MTLVAYTGWLCLHCGTKQMFPDACCDDYILIQVLVSEPDPIPDPDEPVEAGV